MELLGNYREQLSYLGEERIRQKTELQNIEWFQNDGVFLIKVHWNLFSYMPYSFYFQAYREDN